VREFSRDLLGWHETAAAYALDHVVAEQEHEIRASCVRALDDALQLCNAVPG
jgi:hypothetical protein